MSDPIKSVPASVPKSEGGDLVAPAIPVLIPPEPQVKPDLSEPWYRPAKHFIRREQWNRSILRLLNKLGDPPAGEERILRYVGLPGQHHLDLLGMRGICNAKSMRVNYLGFRVGPGAPPTATPVDQLIALSNSQFHTPDSIVVPDNVENIGSVNTPAHRTFNQRGPFDVINLDVCGGVLHGEPISLLSAIKAILLSQNPRREPWLLFLTTLAKHDTVKPEVLTAFFKTIQDNCNAVADFQTQLTAACVRCGVDLAPSLQDPTQLASTNFLRLFTLAFGKWLLVNLAQNSPRAVVTLQSAYQFRNTDRPDPEMLSLAYLVTPIIAGASDPTNLATTSAAQGKDNDGYAEFAIKLVAPSLDEIRDLDEVWHAEPELMKVIILECETLLQVIGVDEAGIIEWRAHHKIAAS